MKRMSNEKILRIIPKKYRKMIDVNSIWWDDEEILLSTVPGYCFDNKEQHIMSFESIEEIKTMFVQVCDCEDCQQKKEVVKMSEEKNIIEDEEMENPAPEGVNETSKATAVKKSAKNKHPKKEEKKEMSMKETLLKMGLKEGTIGKGGKAKRLFIKGVDLSKIVDLCDTEEKYNEIENLAMFGVKTAKFRELIKGKYPTYKVRVTIKKEKKGTRDGISKIIETIKKRFALADDELLTKFVELLNQIKENHKAKKPKKHIPSKGFTAAQEKRIDGWEEAEQLKLFNKLNAKFGKKNEENSEN